MKKSSRFALIWLALALLVPGCAINTSKPNQTFTGSIQSSSTSDRLGAFIIILGDRGDHEYLDQIKYGGESVYNTIRALGFPANRIYYLGPSYGTLSIHQNATTTEAHVTDAIQTWAAPFVSASRGLGMYIFDHGGPGYMCIGGITGNSAPYQLHASTVNTALNNLQTATGVNRIFIIYEACDSGSFIAPLSTPNRIICSATTDSTGSWPSSNWAIFSQPFWGSIAAGNTIGTAFVDACRYVAGTGHGSVQIPWIDDNHDTIGHNLNSYSTLPCGGDGSDALTTKFAYAPQILPARLFRIRYMVMPHYVRMTDGGINLWLVIENNTRLMNVTAAIRPPGFTPSPPIVNDTDLIWQADKNVKNVTLYESKNQPGNYTGYFNGGGTLYNGNYLITYDVFGDNGLFTSQSENITANANGIAPADTTPPTISIDSPFDKENVTNTININVTANDDQGLASLKILVDGNVVKTDNAPTYPYSISCTYDTKNASHTITAVATDLANNVSNQTITVKGPPSGTTIPGFPVQVIIGVSAIGIMAIVILKGRKYLC